MRVYTQLWANYSAFLEREKAIESAEEFLQVQKALRSDFPDCSILNYERRLVSNLLTGNPTFAAQTTVFYLVSHLLEPMDKLPEDFLPAIQEHLNRFLLLALAIATEDPKQLYFAAPQLRQQIRRTVRCTAFQSMYAQIHMFYQELEICCFRKAEYSQKDVFFKDLFAYLEQHFMESSICVEEICRRFGVSKSYFAHNFKKKNGMSFAAFIKLRRLEEAKRLLFATELSVDEIAQLVGYSSGRSLRQVFCQMECMSPGAYRELCRQRE